MAITGAAALAGGIAVGTGTVAMSTVLVAGLALTAVGLVTKTPWLTKLGGGMSMGSGIGSMAAGAGAGATAAGAGADATTAGINSASVADSVGAGSQAAGDVAANTTAAATDTGVAVGAPMAADTGVTATPLADAASTTQAATSTTGAAQAVDPSLTQAANPNAANSINANMSTPSPASQAIAGDTSGYGGTASGSSASGAGSAGNVNPANVNPANANPANVNTPNTIAANNAAASPVAPGNQAPSGQMPVNVSSQGITNAPTAAGPATPSALGGPITGGYSQGNAVVSDANSYGFELPQSQALDAGTLTGSGPGLTTGSNYMGNLLQRMGQWYKDLTPEGKLTVGQIGSGLVQGIGTGVSNMITQREQLALAQQQQDFEHANMSGASSVPKVGVMPSYGANPYTNRNTQATTQATTTPAYPAPQTGLINSAQAA
ncbi:hypothetical protein [Paraburkholderia youngii]|uniref:hypothetical protein n=1 Tax=Paraburkholderia youngii TaxID=2782701 RepID=UPI0015916A2F|nr:hypothetical protein [Paraburkholderia youngii]NUX58644.1 hypothetical protein [Paraburkholderia youngii]